MPSLEPRVLAGTPPIPFLNVKNFNNVLKLGKALYNAYRRGQAPKAIERVDTKIKTDPNGNILHGQQPHVHLKDGRAFNLDGTWKHGEGDIASEIIEWINKFLYP